MKKALVFILVVLVAFSVLGCAGQSADTEPQGEAITAEITPKMVYDDEYITLYYIGVDDDMPGLKFNVVNKSEQDIRFSVDEIAVNGTTEQTAYATDILAGTEVEYICDVSTLDGLEALTAKLFIGDSEGYEIKEGSIKDMPLK